MSTTPIRNSKADVFRRMIKLFTRTGTAAGIIWGRITRRNSGQGDRPIEYPASYWSRVTDNSAPLTDSVMMGRAKTNILKMPTYMMSISRMVNPKSWAAMNPANTVEYSRRITMNSNVGGIPRKTVTTAETTLLTTGTSPLRSRANRVPKIRPRSSVISTAYMVSGTLRAPARRQSRKS